MVLFVFAPCFRVSQTRRQKYEIYFKSQKYTLKPIYFKVMVRNCQMINPTLDLKLVRIKLNKPTKGLETPGWLKSVLLAASDPNITPVALRCSTQGKKMYVFEIDTPHAGDVKNGLSLHT